MLLQTLKIAVVSCLLMVSLSCNKLHPVSCDFTQPLDSVPWVKTLKGSLKNCVCETSIMEGLYKGRPVVYVNFSDATCSHPIPITLYDCAGQVVRTYSASAADQQAFASQVSFVLVDYRCRN